MNLFGVMARGPSFRFVQLVFDSSEMGDAKLGAVDFFIVARVFVAMTVARIDIKPIQLRKRREGIRKIA